MVVKAASLAADAFRHGRAEQPGHGLQFRVVRHARPAGSDELAGPDPGHRRAGLEDDARGGVAERHVEGEPAEHRLPGARDALGACLPHHLPDQVGPCPRLGEQA